MSAFVCRIFFFFHRVNRFQWRTLVFPSIEVTTTSMAFWIWRSTPSHWIYPLHRPSSKCSFEIRFCGVHRRSMAVRVGVFITLEILVRRWRSYSPAEETRIRPVQTKLNEMNNFFNGLTKNLNDLHYITVLPVFSTSFSLIRNVKRSSDVLFPFK